MRKLSEVLHLRFDLKLSYQQIARSCSIALSSVHKYLSLAQAASIGWPLPDGWDEAKLKATLFPPKAAAIMEPAQRTPPDFSAIHQQLRDDKNVTLMLVWEEYKEANADPYGYSRFCELYQRWRSNRMSSCVNNTPPARKCSSIGPAFRDANRTLDNYDFTFNPKMNRAV